MRSLKILGVAVILLAFAGVVTLITLPSRMAREIDSRITAIKAKGDPVCGRDLIPKAVPDAENGAVLYERIFAQIEPDKKALDSAYNIIIPSKSKGHPEVLATARKVEAKFRSILPLIEEAVSRPKLRFDINWNVPPEDVNFSFDTKIRGLTRLLSEMAIVDATDGRMDDSTSVIGLGYRVSECMREEPTILGCLTRNSCIGIDSRALKVSAQYGDIGEAQARRLFDLLGTIDLRSGYVRAMKGERAQGLDIFERAGKGELTGFGSEIATKSRNISSSALGRSWISANKLYYLEYMSKAVEDAERPSRPTLEETHREPDFPKYAMLCAILCPVYTNGKMKTYEAMSTLAGDRNFLAVLAYKSKFGNYPSNLQEAGKKLGWKLPDDPLGDGPFHYRLEGKGFVLYAVGKNMKDDRAIMVSDPTWLTKEVEPVSDRRSAFYDKYPYTNGEGWHSADMNWTKER